MDSKKEAFSRKESKRALKCDISAVIFCVKIKNFIKVKLGSVYINVLNASCDVELLTLLHGRYVMQRFVF